MVAFWVHVTIYYSLFSFFKSCYLKAMVWYVFQVREDTDLFIIDEVGKMELYSSSFFPAVLKVLESNIPILASVPIPKSGRDIPGGTLSQHIHFMLQKQFVSIKPSNEKGFRCWILGVSNNAIDFS